MRVLVCGGRDYDEQGFVTSELDELHRARGPITLVLEGGAPGADTCARVWATARRVPCMTFWADWQLGKKAGPIRNQRMLDHGADLVVAFPGGRGTADMVARARRAGLEVLEIKPWTD